MDSVLTAITFTTLLFIDICQDFPYQHLNFIIFSFAFPSNLASFSKITLSLSSFLIVPQDENEVENIICVALIVGLHVGSIRLGFL